MLRVTVPGSDTLNGWLRRVPTWPIYVLGMLLPGWYLYQGFTGQLGFDPVKEIEHLLGETALITLMLTLAVSPLRRFTGIAFIKFRRALGLLSFYYVTCHLLVWLILDVQIPSQIWADIVKRPYITIGMVAFRIQRCVKPPGSGEISARTKAS